MRPGRSGGTALTWWYTVFAGYAVVVALVTQGPSRAWGVWAAPGYALAALAAWRSRRSELPLLIGVGGAVAAPAIWLAAGWQPGSEPVVVARAAFLLVRHGSPYLPSGQMLSAQSYNPYLPAMSVFGFPRLAGLPGAGGNPASWMAVTSLALIAAAIGIGVPHRAWRRGPGPWHLLRNTALAVVTPVLAFPVALGETDPPVIALMCLALACASRPSAREPATGTGLRPWGAARSWMTWNGLAALAVGTACAMKALAWPALPVLAAMIAAREGPRAAVRFAGIAAATAVILTTVFAPALLAKPGAFADNIIAYPLGLTTHLTPAASPLPGHLLASTGTPGRLAALVLLLAAGACVAASLVLRPPRNAQAAAVRLALGLTMLFALAPNARFGYFAYPAALLGWLALTARGASHGRQHRLGCWGSTAGRGGWEMDDDKRTRKALAKLEKSVRYFERHYGPGDRRTLNARTTLAHEYHAAGRTAEGIAMLEQAAADSERLNGPDHTSTLDARMNLAFGFRETGETAEILPVLEQIATDSERIFGPGHKDTLPPRLILALTYRENGRPGEAIPVLEQLVADRERITGLDPRDTWSARGYLALSYLEAGHADEAIAIFEQIAPEVERFVSPYTHSTLDRLDVAPLYAAAGRTDEAIAAAEWGADDRAYRCGPDDPLTVAARTLLAQLQAARQGS